MHSILILSVRGKKGIGKKNKENDTGCSKQNDTVTYKILQMVFKDVPAWYLLTNCIVWKTGDRWICKVWHASKGEEGKQGREV